MNKACRDGSEEALSEKHATDTYDTLLDITILATGTNKIIS
jgi:hypothetical protein